MRVSGQSLQATCAKLHFEFFRQLPNDELHRSVERTLAELTKSRSEFAGDPAGWAAGLVLAVGSEGCGVPGMLNAELEKAFGVSMGTIRRRAAEIRDELPLDVLLTASDVYSARGWTLRDEANALCAYAFRNGFIEDIHADGRITDPEMRRLMTEASASLAKLLTMKARSPQDYERFIKDYHRKYCRYWQR